MRIIPAIDIIGGKCVRLTKGDYETQKVYYEKPLEIAKLFEDTGLQFLHLVDLDGAKSKHIVNHKVLYEITTKTKLKIDFGGGLKTDEDLKIAFENGANQITAGSVAANNPDMVINWLKIYGTQKIILGADCNNRKIATNGWLQQSNIDVIDFIKYFELQGIKNVICTDIAKDGMLQGASNELYKEILASIKINLIASGGVSAVQDLIDLKNIGCEAAIVGKAIYEGKISLNELKNLC